MAVKKKLIQVPESIASEVKLFAKLLGEINSVYDLLQEIESRAEEEVILSPACLLTSQIAGYLKEKMILDNSSYPITTGTIG